jgi:hemoglobin/transferrin/lactoferrin receptor protein
VPPRPLYGHFLLQQCTINGQACHTIGPCPPKLNYMKQLLTMLATGLCCGTALAQPLPANDSTDKVMGEVVISASKFAEKKKNIAQKIDVISARAIALTNAQNTGDLLINTGKIFVQKSQQGGSSPVIRGFEASRVTLVIDGIRMNNAIYRSGHLQNVITVDQNMLQRVEVMYGPASTIYGSDGLGGIIHLQTKNPVLSGTDKKMTTHGAAFARYSGANNEKTIHAHASIGGNRVAWLQSYTFSDFGDMKMGRRYPDRYPDFGRRSFYIDRINGIDSVVKNNDDRVQKFSGYRQWDITQKLLVRQSGNVQHLLNFQYSNTNNVPRYDRLQDIRNGTLRFAEWYYGPQKRLLAAYELNATDVGFMDELKVNVSYQDIEESRQTREYRRYDRFDSRVEKVKVGGLAASFRKKWTANELTAGMDAQLNQVRSSATRTHINTGTVTSLDTRYPDGRNSMDYAGIFAQHLYKSPNGKWVFNDGVRLQWVMLRSNIDNNSFFRLPDTVFSQKHIAVSGNIGVIYNPHKNTRLSLSLATGFRAPNIDDLAKLFESSTAARQVVVPNGNIQPEYTYNIDLSVTQQLANKGSVELTGFYTLLRNALVKAPFRLNGQDSIVYDGVRSQVLANQNSNRGYLFGFSASLVYNITQRLTLSSDLSYTFGRFETDPSVASSVFEKQANGTYSLVRRNVRSKPLDHIPPLIGKTALVYQAYKWRMELFALYNGWKRLNQFNADGEDNAQYATPDGMPGWVTANWRGSYNIHKTIQLQAGVENIFDRNYRYFASGFSAPGVNIYGAVRINWSFFSKN